jgi:hypothetical protein
MWPDSLYEARTTARSRVPPSTGTDLAEPVRGHPFQPRLCPDLPPAPFDDVYLLPGADIGDSRTYETWVRLLSFGLSGLVVLVGVDGELAEEFAGVAALTTRTSRSWTSRRTWHEVLVAIRASPEEAGTVVIMDERLFHPTNGGAQL